MTEVLDVRDLEPVLEVADVLQVGARNMQNYPLLTEIGRSGRPALIKRGFSSTLDELLLAAEYVLNEGNEHVVLCERGIRTFETAYRFTLDLLAVPVLKQRTHLPVIVDPEPCRRTPRAGDRRCHWPPPRRAPTESSSRSTRGRRRRSATARSRCAPSSSRTTCDACTPPPRWRARPCRGRGLADAHAG